MEDYDIQIDYNRMVEFIATEICRNPDYTRYMKTPLTQGEVNYSLIAMSENTEYSRLVAELYLPALATALDLHLRVIQNIGGYYGVMNTLPLPNETNTKQKKTITLILIDGTYHPVVQASTTDLPTTTYTTIKTGYPAQYPVYVMEEEAPPEVLVPETQVDNTPNSPPAITHSPIVIPESPYATPHTPAVIPESPVLTISPVKPEPQVTRGIKRRRLSQTSRNWRTSAQGNAEELIIISSDSETDGDASPVFLGSNFETPQPHITSTHEKNIKRQLQIIDRELSIKEEDEDIPYCPELTQTGKRVSFNMRPFCGMIPEVVNKLPHDINGVKFYIIDVPQEDPFHTKYRDGRHFELHSSSRKGFQGVRRVGKCRGSFTCQNDGCPIYKDTQKRNKHQFTTIGKNKFCYSCNCLANREACGALKLIEFNMQSRLLEVYHQGQHICQCKPNVEANDILIEENIKKFGADVGPKQLAQMKMTEVLKKQMDSGDFDMDEIVDIAAKMTDKARIRRIRQKLHHELKSEKHSISAVAELKVCTDTSDNFLIYKIYDHNMSGTGISHIFKSSRRMAHLLLNMDQDSELDNPLKHEPCYFDGMHKRCQNWKTLTLWVYHPSSRKLMRLATCEVKGETSQSCAIFWKCLNSMLQDVTNKPDTKFNPCFLAELL